MQRRCRQLGASQRHPVEQAVAAERQARAVRGQSQIATGLQGGGLHGAETKVPLMDAQAVEGHWPPAHLRVHFTSGNRQSEFEFEGRAARVGFGHERQFKVLTDPD